MSSLSFAVSTRTGNELGANRPKTLKLSDEIILTFIFSSHLLETHGEWFSLEATRFPALRWTMENMLQHSTCQSFGTDCKELIAMIKELRAWPRFAT
ncbi:hypothetical protein DY000_02022186 [Brassica cretica]|uniref:Uncharacterized protein n=1 Tax=Brassica cretica TaxID=69181 RepID=A0ABQ7EEW8_BRACR|nr:hypothetical protein DY000_02022186 [Brassica cretica]